MENLNDPTAADGLGGVISLEAISKAEHPAVARAVAEILANRLETSDFSSFTSHASCVPDEMP